MEGLGLHVSISRGGFKLNCSNLHVLVHAGTSKAARIFHIFLETFKALEPLYPSKFPITSGGGGGGLGEYQLMVVSCNYIMQKIQLIP